MVFLYILFALLTVVFVFLISFVEFSVFFEEGLILELKIAGITVYSYPEPIKKKLKKEKKKKLKKEKQTEAYDKKDLLKNIKPILSFCLKVTKRVGKLLSHLKVKKLDFDLTVSTEDAYKTSMYYGELCAVVYPLYSLLCSYNNEKNIKMIVSADFDVINPELKFVFNGKVRIFFAGISAIMILLDFLKSGILKGADKNE